MINERTDLISEQTAYLLLKQKELLDNVKSNYLSLLSFIDDKLKVIDRDSESQELEDLKFIYDHVVNHKKGIESQIKEDIEFLEEQSNAIKQIQEVDDKDKSEELLDIIIDKDEKLLSIDEFKNQVDSDLEQANKELRVVVEDLKSALDEDDAHSVRLLLEAAAEEARKSEENCTDGCCSHETDCSSCPSSCCASEDESSDDQKEDKDGVDIFESFSDKE